MLSIVFWKDVGAVNASDLVEKMWEVPLPPDTERGLGLQVKVLGAATMMDFFISFQRTTVQKFKQKVRRELDFRRGLYYPWIGAILIERKWELCCPNLTIYLTADGSSTSHFLYSTGLSWHALGEMIRKGVSQLNPFFEVKSQCQMKIFFIFIFLHLLSSQFLCTENWNWYCTIEIVEALIDFDYYYCNITTTRTYTIENWNWKSTKRATQKWWK